MPTAPAAAPRLKREDSPRTKHDSLFSPWKVLNGPLDWDDHSAGKEGVQRYRTRNLPDNFPGLYELGVARASDEGVRTRSRTNGLGGDVVVVYLGQADNVRARLQQYGRTGSHLETGNPLASVGKAEMNMLAAGTGLFREVFSRGYSVMFRCALMGNKQEAEKTETQLLRVFDYAWNKLQNGACRREEILLKLEQGSHRSSLLTRIRHFKQKLFAEKVGIKINTNGSVDISSGSMKHMLPRVCTFVGFRPQLVNSGDNLNEAIDIHRKYASKHNIEGLKDTRSKRSMLYNEEFCRYKTLTLSCGVMLEDGSSCLEHPVQGRKRCQLHKGRRVRVTGRKLSSSSYTCQVGISTVESVPRITENASKSDQAQQTSGDVSNILSTTMEESSSQRNSLEAKEIKIGEAPIEDGTCRSSHAESHAAQPSGRKWFQLLKAQKSASAPLSRDQGCQTRVTDDAAAISGVVRDNGYCKMVPVAGRKRCEEHKGIKVTSASFVPSPGISGCSSICGAQASDGSPCKNQPVAGRKRCALHKGQRARCSPPPSIE